jgi:hypothetical protein
MGAGVAAMKPSQIAQLQDLSKCTGLRRFDALCLKEWRLDEFRDECMDKAQKAWLRRLTRQYRNQIKAVKRNQRRQG